MKSFQILGLAIVGLAATGCSNYSRSTPVVIFTDMDYQHRFEPQGDRNFAGGHKFFDDGRASRRPVEGTIAIGHLVEDEGFNTGVVNNAYVGQLQRGGMVVSGVNPRRNLVEVIELKGHPWFVGTQAHPEFQSKPNKAHPLFAAFIAAALKHHRGSTPSRSRDAAKPAHRLAEKSRRRSR